jgi:hypothetical protein
MKKSLGITIIVFFLYPSFLYCQIRQNESEYYSWFDKVVGINNTSLYDGIEYKEKYIKRNENSNFFQSSNFLSGSVNYGGESYFHLELKYDVYEQEVLVKLQNRKSGEVVIKLVKNKIDNFYIGDHKFVKIEDNRSGVVEMTGFYEVSVQSSFFTFFTKHQKIKRDVFHEGNIFHEFIDAKNKYVLLYKKKYHFIKNKKDLINIFPKLKKDLHIFYKINRSIRKSKPDIFMIAVLKHIDNLMSKVKNL